MAQPQANLPEDFDILEGYSRFRPAGEVSLQEAVGRISKAIVFGRENRIGRLLVDATQLGGFPSPSVGERYWIAKGLALDSAGLVTVSFALQPYLLDPERFGVTVAANFGMNTSAFDSATEALKWLLTQPDQSPKS